MMHASSVGVGATLRALSSLNHRDAAFVRASVHAAGSMFAVEEHDDYDGYLSLMLTPVTPSADGYLLSGQAGRIDLARLRGDDLCPLGCFTTVAAAMLFLRPRLLAALDRSDAFP